MVILLCSRGVFVVGGMRSGSLADFDAPGVQAVLRQLNVTCWRPRRARPPTYKYNGNCIARPSGSRARWVSADAAQLSHCGVGVRHSCDAWVELCCDSGCGGLSRQPVVRGYIGCVGSSGCNRALHNVFWGVRASRAFYQPAGWVETGTRTQGFVKEKVGLFVLWWRTHRRWWSPVSFLRRQIRETRMIPFSMTPSLEWQGLGR